MTYLFTPPITNTHIHVSTFRGKNNSAHAQMNGLDGKSSVYLKSDVVTLPSQAKFSKLMHKSTVYSNFFPDCNACLNLHYRHKSQICLCITCLRKGSEHMKLQRHISLTTSFTHNNRLNLIV